MTCLTPTAPNANARRRKANSPRLTNAIARWVDAMRALEAACDACDALSEAMGDLLPNESDPIHGDDVREDAWHCAYFVRSQLSLIESSATGEIIEMVRAKS